MDEIIEKESETENKTRCFFGRLLSQTWLCVLFIIIILCSAWMATVPEVELHRYDSYKTIFYIGGIGFSIVLFIVSISVKNTKHNRFGMLSFLMLLSFVLPAILLMVQILFNIDRFIKPSLGKILLYAFFGLLLLSFLLSILGLLLRRQKTDFLLSLAVFILFSSQIVLPILCKQTLRYYHIKNLGCPTNLQRLSKVYIFASTTGEAARMQKDRWCDFLHQEWDVEIKQFLCRDDSFGPCSYAMNKNIQVEATDLPPDLVLLFESAPGWNRVGGPEDVVTNRHGKNNPGANIAFADGHVEFVKPDDIPKLRWIK